MGTPSNQAQAAYSPGDVFARRYVIEHLLGAGFQAEVYAVKNKHTGAARALKLLKARHQSNAEYVQRFLQEAEQLTSLSHHNLVRVFDAGIEDTGEVWMLMELLEGRSLRKCMQELGSASVPLSLFIVREVARAIALAHEQDVMHRDVKPENIMVTPDGVKVLDFGIAKVYGSAVPTTDRKMRTLGTIAYMAPEQVASLPPTLSVDVYALGIVLYELLAGAHPFADVLHDALEVGKRQMFHTPPMISTRIVGVPDYVETVLNGALEKNRAHRTSMAQFAEQLDEAFQRFEREAAKGDIAWHLRPVEAPYFESLLPKSPLREEPKAEAPPESDDAVGPHGTEAMTPSPYAEAFKESLEEERPQTPRPARGTVKMETPQPQPASTPPPRAELPSAAGGPRPELSGVLKEVVSQQAEARRSAANLEAQARAARAEAITLDGPVVSAPAVAHAVSPTPSTVSVRSLVSVLCVGVPLTVLATWAYLDHAGAGAPSDATSARSEEADATPDGARDLPEAPASSATAAVAEASSTATGEVPEPSATAEASAEAVPTAAAASPPPVATTPAPKSTWKPPPPSKKPDKRPSGRVF